MAEPMTEPELAQHLEGHILGDRHILADMTGLGRPARLVIPPPSSRTFRSEALLARAAVERVRDVWGGHARKVHGGPHQAAGEPDIDACVHGRAVKIELKQPGNKPSPVQMGAMRRWATSGALVGWCTSLAELDELLSHVFDLDWTNPQLEKGQD